MDVLDIFKFTYSWIQERDSQRLYLLLIGINFAATLLVLLGLIFLFGSALLPIMLLSGAGELANQIPSSVLITLSGFGIAGAIIGLALLIFVSLARSYFELMTMFRAFALKGIHAPAWTPRKYVHYIILGIMHAIYAVLSLLNRRFFPLVAAFFVLCALSVSVLAYSIINISGGAGSLTGLLLPNLLLLTLTGLVALPYAFLVIYNSIRQSMCFPIYLQGEMRKTAALERSWALTEGRVIEIFITSFAIGLAWGIAFMVVGFFLDLLLQATAITLLAFVLYLVLKYALAPFDTFTGSFMSVGIYDSLRAESGNRIARQPAVREGRTRSKRR